MPHRQLCLVLVTLATAAVAAGCEADPPPIDRQPPPAHDGVYSFANGCYAIEAFDGDGTLRYLAPSASDDGFELTARRLDQAARLRMRPSDLGIYLLYDAERRYVAAAAAGSGSGSDPDAGSGSDARSRADSTAALDATGAASYTLTRLAQLDSKVDRLDDAFKSPAEWRLQVSTRDGERFQLQHYATDRYLTLTGLTDDASKAAIITLHPVKGCAAFPELSIDAVGKVRARKWADGSLYGIAEIHSHMMSHAGFGGGGLFHGAAFHRLGVEKALLSCTKSHGADGRRDLLGYFYDGGSRFDLDALLPIASQGTVSGFNHDTTGYPDFTEWPNSWRRATHQTMYYRWLQRAYLAGLRLLVQHATGNSVLCDLTVALGAQKTLYSCNDMVSVDRAIAGARALERYIDAQAGGPGKGWLRVVESPRQAREAIEAGKLAMVLGIEISNLFDCFLTPPKGGSTCTAQMVRDRVEHYRKLGVRVVFPVHKFDNAFSAGDGDRGMIELGNFINSGHYSSYVTDCPGISTTFDRGDVTFGGLNKPRPVYGSKAPNDMSRFVKDPLKTLLPFLGDVQAPALEGKYCQKHGLTPLGETLFEALMARGMLIDLAHLPQRALVRAYEILEKNKYPATKTHGNSTGGRIYRLGGMVGANLGRCGNPDKPGTMVNGLTARVALATANGAYPAEALNFDLNGLAGGPRPRFGKSSRCGRAQTNPVTYPFWSYDKQVVFTRPYLGNRMVDFNVEGMIHIGLLPELIEDVRRDGASDKALEPLFRSAEAFIRMWEQAEARAKQIAKP